MERRLDIYIGLNRAARDDVLGRFSCSVSFEPLRRLGSSKEPQVKKKLNLGGFAFLRAHEDQFRALH